MFWIAILAMSFVFIKLGMLVVMVKVLAIPLQLALLVIAGLAIAFFWRKLFAPKLKTYKLWQPKQIISKGE